MGRPRTNKPPGRPKTAPGGEKRTVSVHVALAPVEATTIDTARGDTPRAEYIRNKALSPPRDGEEA